MLDVPRLAIFRWSQATGRCAMRSERQLQSRTSYIGRGVRTIQCYEVQFGLPVRRPAGSSRSSVMAFCDEIDAWLSRTPTHYSREVINLTVKPSEMGSKTVLNANRVSDALDTCPLCCGTGKNSNSKHVEYRPGSESVPQTEN